MFAREARTEDHKQIRTHPCQPGWFILSSIFLKSEFTRGVFSRRMLNSFFKSSNSLRNESGLIEGGSALSSLPVLRLTIGPLRIPKRTLKTSSWLFSMALGSFPLTQVWRAL